MIAVKIQHAVFAESMSTVALKLAFSSTWRCQHWYFAFIRRT